jgi:hypothetical protein
MEVFPGQKENVGNEAQKSVDFGHKLKLTKFRNFILKLLSIAIFDFEIRFFKSRLFSKIEVFGDFQAEAAEQSV